MNVLGPIPVNNRPETGKANQRSFFTAAGWLFAHPAVAHEKLGRSTLVSRAQRSKKWHAASRPGHAIASDAFVALFTFQTAHLVPAAHCVRPGFCIFASLTPSRGVGGAPRNVRVQRHPLGVS
jgi:hypothetical protein